MTYGQCRMGYHISLVLFLEAGHKFCTRKCIGMVGTLDADLDEFTPGCPNEEAKWEVEPCCDIGNGS